MMIAFTELEGWEKPIIRKELAGHELLLTEEELTPENADMFSDAEVLSIFIYSKIDEEVLRRLPKLKVIISRSTGVDHIDLGACRKRGIRVFNIPDYGTNTVAEFTFLLIAALMRKFKLILRAVEENDIDVLELRGNDLRGKTIGIVGTGRIGGYVARLAHAYGMHILAYDKYPRRELVERYGVRYVSLEELLSNSDIITLHLPLTPETYHIINRRNIRLIKRGAILINTARGALVETEALIEALNEGILSGAALDVVECEQLMREDIDIVLRAASTEDLRVLLANEFLKRHPNVILTPHIAYNTWEAVNRILRDTLHIIKAYVEGAPLPSSLV